MKLTPYGRSKNGTLFIKTTGKDDTLIIYKEGQEEFAIHNVKRHLKKGEDIYLGDNIILSPDKVSILPKGTDVDASTLSTEQYCRIAREERVIFKQKKTGDDLETLDILDFDFKPIPQSRRLQPKKNC